MKKISPKIGILNLQQVDNFGCVLGAYALLKTVRNEYQTEAELINYHPEYRKFTFSDKIKRKLRRCKYFGIANTVQVYIKNKQLQHKIRASDSEKNKPERAERFEMFRNSYLTRSKVYTTSEEMRLSDYDIYLVGSDVVWLLEDLYVGDPPAFLEFTKDKKCKRISYAASLGDMPYKFGKRKAVKELYRNGLKNFDKISVREEMSEKYLSELCKKNIACCIDPTLLLDAADYNPIVAESCSHYEEKYIYVYLLDDSGDLYEIINQISIDTGLPIIRCCDIPGGFENVVKKAEGDGPAEFLDHIRNASLVITNSFHAVCFSLIYHKEFFVIRRNTQAYKTEELLKHIGLTDRYLDISGGNKKPDKPIDFDEVDKRLETWKKESMEYLKNALSDNN